MHRIALVLAVVLPLIGAHSTRPPPLARGALSHPSDQRVTIIPRRLASPLAQRAVADSDQPAWDDSFLLSFSTHDRPVVLSLRPSTTLVHPDGIKVHHTHTSEDGQRTEEVSYIRREDVRAYEGWVLDPEDSVERWTREEIAGVRRHDPDRGAARIVLLTQGDGDEELQFQGTFTHDGELYTVHSTSAYLSKRDSLDPSPPLLLKRTLSGLTYVHPSMVVIRESDVLSPQEHLATLRQRGLPVPDEVGARAVSCGHDSLPFNVDPAHPVYESAIELAAFASMPTTPWPLGLFGMPSRSSAATYAYPPKQKLVKRQGDISGSTNASGNFISSIGSTVGCVVRRSQRQDSD